MSPDLCWRSLTFSYRSWRGKDPQVSCHVDGREIAVYLVTTGTGRELVCLTERLPGGDQIINEPVVVNGGVHHEPDGLSPALQVPGGVSTVYRAVFVVREYFAPILAGSDLPNCTTLRLCLPTARGSRSFIEEYSVRMECMMMELCAKTFVLILSKIVGRDSERIMRGGRIVS